MIKNKRLELSIAPEGYVSTLRMLDDPHRMNWVIDEQYLSSLGYKNADKLFGQFTIKVNDIIFNSTDVTAFKEETLNTTIVTYLFDQFQVTMTYNMQRDEQLLWDIQVRSLCETALEIQYLGIWASLANIMFRDKEVLRNMQHSAAVFPSISTHYTKLNAVRRSNTDGNLAMYQQKGETLSIGTYCDYENLFFENVSPSLDGMIFHQLILANDVAPVNNDWIYEQQTYTLAPNEALHWQYILAINTSQDDFYHQALAVGHPHMRYEPLTILGQTTRVEIEHPHKVVEQVSVQFKKSTIVKENVLFSTTMDITTVTYKASAYGEHKLIVHFDDDTEDFVVFNVMAPLADLLEERVAYICDTLYNGPTGQPPYAFEPISNQGESIGKLNLVLQKNLIGTLDTQQVHQVEASAVYYVKEKWFIDGDLRQPHCLYGEFYRCMDFEYIGHLFYLLAQFDDKTLALNSANTYLQWAAEVFQLRVNPDWHHTARGKEEAQMLGVYFLYVNDLLAALKVRGFDTLYEQIDALWRNITQRIDAESSHYEAAVTEHFYDNAGFGPTAGALSASELYEGTVRYGTLLLANIGYSNDFRAQNPDRWWEALTYMIHSLWGGITAAAAYRVYDYLEDVVYLEASYRATAGILYCYDTNATATTPLKKGMAASTYAVAGPHLNRPDLSRGRFGQATFFKDGGIFSRLFENDTQTPDWDMGEELIPYLETFGQQTFIIQEEHAFRVINGTYEYDGEDIVVTSYAPYSQKFWLIKDGKRALVANEKGKTILRLTPYALT